MSKSYTFKAEIRERVGKGSSRKLRRNGLIPAVIYGDKQPPLAISVPYKEIFYKIHAGGFRTTVATIEIDKQKIQVLPKDYQLDPVRDFPIHVDFLRISAKSVVHVHIPVHFLNEDIAPGIKRGGVLNIVRHEIECTALAHAIPEAIEIDLSSYSIGDSIHISAVQLPKGVTPVIQERDFTIATIAAPASISESDNSSEKENNENNTKA
ncbi:MULTISPECIES: 50S ribosomal protein L25/general stress protein Ctc [unclassified Bartonella]|uniref:50S ribosomal protein L25/general stress protein Ctc n=1 Tax=unclassified Bartonella TaxID=2645622 RepID=UPI00099A9BE6|nr:MULTISPECIES: 50S ribosomal protein L25/general stress protein Ctc [unclassified Bartonella]AQX27598.1 LSU ribosomal protein L25P [Bartonella sp. JB15]AQX28879.1 LSU ribosomal protein L25P [Bartonella sp. JB63]